MSIDNDPVPTCVGPLAIKNINQYRGAIVASLGGFLFGISLGWNSSSGEVFRNVLSATSAEIGLAGGILNVGACVAPAILPFAVKLFSRVSLMLLTLPIVLCGWLLICCANQSILMYIIGRLLCGFSGGVFCVLSPIFIAEIAHKETRGRVLAIFQLSINCGVMYAFVMDYVLEEQESVWRYSICCTVPCLMLIFVRLLPESPLYYLGKEDEINATRSLKFYRPKEYELHAEMEEWRYLAKAKQLRKVSWGTFNNLRVAHSFVTCFAVIVTQQLSGVYAIIFYAMTIFNAGGSGEFSANQLSLIVASAQIVSCLLAIVFIDYLGRRVLLTVSSALMAVFLILLGWFFQLRKEDPEYDDIYSWMPPLWITLFLAAFNLGVGPISWTLLGDAFPAEIRLGAASVAVSFSWLLCFIVTMTFDVILMKLEVQHTLWMFSGICWLSAAFSTFVVKDHTGQSLSDIQKGFLVGTSGVTGDPGT